MPLADLITQAMGAQRATASPEAAVAGILPELSKTEMPMEGLQKVNSILAAIIEKLCKIGELLNSPATEDGKRYSRASKTIAPMAKDVDIKDITGFISALGSMFGLGGGSGLEALLGGGMPGMPGAMPGGMPGGMPGMPGGMPAGMPGVMPGGAGEPTGMLGALAGEMPLAKAA